MDPSNPIRRCHNCGVGKIIPLAKAGRTEGYHGEIFEIPADLEIPTCDHCGEEWFDLTTAEKIDAALKPLYEEKHQAICVGDIFLDRISNTELVVGNSSDPRILLYRNWKVAAHCADEDLRNLGKFKRVGHMELP
jgi:hypothetical protein